MHRSLIRAEGVIITDITPKPSGPGLAVSGGQHRDRGVVGVDPFGGHHVRARRLDQRT